MTDPQSQDLPETKAGAGKAFAAAGTTFAAVLIAFYLQNHYADLIKALNELGYPMPVFVASVAALLSHLITWWTSADIVASVIGAIKSWKKIVNAWKSPN